MSSSSAVKLPETTDVTPPWVLLLRHIVALAALSAAAHGFTYKSFTPLDWGVKFLLVVLIALALAGLWALFFTTRSKGHFNGNFIRLTWVLVVLVAAGDWQGVPTQPPVAQAAHAPVVNGNERLAKLRQEPEYSQLTDESIVMAEHLLYPTTSIETIAVHLGVPMTPYLRKMAQNP